MQSYTLKNIIELTETNSEQELSGAEKPVLVDFCAPRRGRANSRPPT
jgi:hypothetical protein